MKLVGKPSCVAVWGVLLSLGCAAASGYPLGSNGWRLDSPFQTKANADVVAKVHIGRIREVGTAPSPLSPGGPEVSRKVAEAQVVSVVKGECPAAIEIEYEFPTTDDPMWGLPIHQLFTALTPGESCLMFLKGTGSPYRIDRVQSKARVIATPVPYDLGDDPLLRLLAEFLAGATSDDEMTLLQAVEELGYIGEELMRQIQPFTSDSRRSRQMAEGLKRARRAVQTVRSSPAFVLHSAAVISSFQLADPPALDETLQILLADPSELDSAGSKAKYGIGGFAVPQVQEHLLEVMDATTRRAIKDLDDGSRIAAPGGRQGIYRGTPGFPYARFFRAALSTDAVAQGEDMRQAIANVIWIRYERASVPEMIQLLDDPVTHIRQTAVSALNKSINRNFSNEWDRRTFYQMDEVSGPSDRKPLEQRLQDYEQNEREYIQYWKAWWVEHRTKFEYPATTLSYGMEY